MSDHMMLAIVKGLPPIDGDDESLEVIDDILDLLNTEGFSVNEKGWIPKQPQVKNGGVYIDNPAFPDRIPVAFELGQVQESMTLTVTASTYDGRYWLESRLARLAQAARDFWTTENQIQPVYLKWQSPGAKRPQYALIYNIDIAGSKDIFQVVNVGQIVITIDREYGWRVIPPGASPKAATSIILGGDGSVYPINAGFHSSSAMQLVKGYVKNSLSFNTLYTFNTVNYLDVAANKIPGDLPAAVYLGAVSSSGLYNDDLYIAKKTNPTSVRERGTGLDLPYFNSFPCSASVLQHADATFVVNAMYGIVHTPVSPNQNCISFTATATTERYIAKWQAGGTCLPHINPYILRGTYMVFVRGAQLGGVANQIKIRVEIDATNSAVVFNSAQVSAQISANGPTLHYMGIVTIGTNIADMVGDMGLSTASGLTVNIYAQRTAGAGVLMLSDIILLPIEEGALLIRSTGLVTSPALVYEDYDNTGFLGHGAPPPAIKVDTNVGLGAFPSELTGQALWLTPRINNRLYFLPLNRQYSPPTMLTEWATYVTVNIVPRWSGVVDI